MSWRSSQQVVQMSFSGLNCYDEDRQMTNTHILSFTTDLSKVSNVLTSQTLWNLDSDLCNKRNLSCQHAAFIIRVSSTTSATHTDTRLTYRLHCHSGSLWLAVGLAVGFPFRHSTLVDTRIWRRDLIKLQGEGVSRRACCLHCASGELPSGFHNALLTQADDICKNGCRGCFVLPGDGELTFDSMHLTCEHQLVTFIDFHSVLHFNWEATFCDETRDNRHVGEDKIRHHNNCIWKNVMSCLIRGALCNYL